MRRLPALAIPRQRLEIQVREPEQAVFVASVALDGAEPLQVQVLRVRGASSTEPRMLIADSEHLADAEALAESNVCTCGSVACGVHRAALHLLDAAGHLPVLTAMASFAPAACDLIFGFPGIALRKRVAALTARTRTVTIGGLPSAGRREALTVVRDGSCLRCGAHPACGHRPVWADVTSLRTPVASGLIKAWGTRVHDDGSGTRFAVLPGSSLGAEVRRIDGTGEIGLLFFEIARVSGDLHRVTLQTGPDGGILPCAEVHAPGEACEEAELAAFLLSSPAWSAGKAA